MNLSFQTALFFMLKRLTINSNTWFAAKTSTVEAVLFELIVIRSNKALTWILRN